MANFAFMLNGGFWMRDRGAFLPATITAGAGNDGVAVNGLIIDRGEAGLRYPMCAKIAVNYVANVNTGETMTAALKVQHGSASDGSDMADYTDEYGYGAFASATVESGPLTSKSNVVVINMACDGMKRYVRAVSTLNLSRSGTDTVAYSGMWTFGGLEAIPTTDNSYSVSA